MITRNTGIHSHTTCRETDWMHRWHHPTTTIISNPLKSKCDISCVDSILFCILWGVVEFARGNLEGREERRAFRRVTLCVFFVWHVHRYEKAVGLDGTFFHQRLSMEHRELVNINVPPKWFCFELRLSWDDTHNRSSPCWDSYLGSTVMNPELCQWPIPLTLLSVDWVQIYELKGVMSWPKVSSPVFIFWSLP